MTQRCSQPVYFPELQATVPIQVLGLAQMLKASLTVPDSWNHARPSLPMHQKTAAPARTLSTSRISGFVFHLIHLMAQPSVSPPPLAEMTP